MSEQDYGHVDWTPKTALEFYAAGKHFDVVDGRTRIIDTGAIASDALKQLSTEYAQLKGLTTQDYSALQSQVRQLASALEKAEKWIDESFDFEMPLAKHKSGCELRDEIRAALAAINAQKVQS